MTIFKKCLKFQNDLTKILWDVTFEVKTVYGIPTFSQAQKLWNQKDTHLRISKYSSYRDRGQKAT